MTDCNVLPEPTSPAQFLRSTLLLKVCDYPGSHAYFVEKPGFRALEERGDPSVPFRYIQSTGTACANHVYCYPLHVLGKP